MKISSTIFLLLIKTTLLCQTDQITPDSLIKKYHIKKINAFFMLDDPKMEKLYYTNQYDSLGNIITHQTSIKNSHNGGTNFFYKYFYENNLLIKIVKNQDDYGEEGDSEDFTDTTIFVYDHLSRLLRKSESSYYRGTYPSNYYRHSGTVVVDYEYLNDTITIAKQKISNQVVYDTLIYNREKLLIREISQGKRGAYTYIYNNRKQLVSRTFTRSDSKSLIDQDTSIYKEGRLIRKELRTLKRDGSLEDTRSFDYIYYENGLAQVFKQIYKQNILSNIIYRYEYY